MFVMFALPASATTGVNQEISFEGKIVNASGINIADGTYNVEFKIYTAAGSCNPTSGAGCTLGWTEDWLVSGGNGVSFTSGTFQVNLDHVAANNFSGIDFNTYPLYLSIQIGSTSSCAPAGNFTANCGGDGEMKPYIKFTSTPYSLNSNLLDGLDSTAFAQLAGNQSWTGTNTFQPTTNINGVTIKQTSTASPTADIFDVQSANGSSIIQVTGPSANNAAVSITSLGANAITLTSGAALNFTGAANSTWDLGPGHTLSIQTTNNGAITTGTGLLTVGGNLTFSGTALRTITGPSTGGLNITAAGPVGISATGSNALTLTATAASTWDIGNNTLSLQTTNNGQITTGAGLLTLGGNVTFSGTSARMITGPSTGGLTLTVASGPLNLTTTSSGALTITAAAASTWSTSAGALTLQSASGSAFTAAAQGAGQSNFGTVGSGNTVIGNTTGDIHLIGAAYASNTGGVLVGDGTVSATPILLQLNNSSLAPASEASANCSTTINAGAIYYSAATISNNTTTNDVRGCIDGSWTDIVTADQLGILMFGVVPDSGNSPGDVTGLSSYLNAPCKVSWASSTSVSVAPCTAYSGGRKVVISSAVTIAGLGTAGSIRYQHICLNDPLNNNGPKQTLPNTSETAGVPTFSATAPVLCLATVKLSTTPAITNIYDTRVFTTSVKEFVGNTTALAPGWMVVSDASGDNLVTTTSTAGATNVRGAVAVGNPTTSTTNVGAIIVTSGLVYVKFTTVPSIGAVAQTGTTLGYMTTTTNSNKYGLYRDMGQVVANGNTATCNAVASCQWSALVDVVLY